MAEWARHPLHRLRSAKAGREAWRKLFPEGLIAPLDKLAAPAQADARCTADLILEGHDAYFSEFDAVTAQAKQIFEARAWRQGVLNAEKRVRLYREAVNGTWSKLQVAVPVNLPDREFWMGARQCMLERVFERYDADLALTFFYSTMRLAFDSEDMPVEYDDDGLAERLHVWSPRPVYRVYLAEPENLRRTVLRVLSKCDFQAPFEDAPRDASLVSARLLGDWRREIGATPPHNLQMLKPIFFRDQEAYLVGKLCSPEGELPVVLALRNEEAGITVDAILSGKEDMRNILFVSTRSTFHVRTADYREVLSFLHTLAPERGHPAMCAVIGFTHPARVELNQRIRRHLQESSERFEPPPGRVGMAMIVFSAPSFPYVFKVVRDFSSKVGWTGRGRIMDVYRWVHEMNRGRLMLDAWVYRNLRFPRAAFEDGVIRELLTSAPNSVRVDDETVILKHVYAQRRVVPLSTFFEETEDRSLRERAIDSLGNFIKDLAGMGFFIGDHYGLPSNTGLTHAMNVALFDFDDLGPLPQFTFRETPHMADEQDELMWNSEADGAWFSVGENDVLVDEWERFLGVPEDLKEFFRQKHGDLFTTAYWDEAQKRVVSGQLHYVVPYPPERRIDKTF